MFEFSGPSLTPSKQNVILVGTLALQAGAINVGGFLGAHRFVTHTTGFATLFGSEMASGHALAAIGILSVPAFFITGSAISAVFVDLRISKRLRPHYSLLFFLISLLMYGVALMGLKGVLGGFGSPANIFADYLLLASLCLSSGIQNAAITSASGATLRTTHLSGITTDLGINLTRILFREKQSSQDKTSLIFRLTVLFGFLGGSVIFAFVFKYLDYWGFLGPGLISSLLALYSLKES